jgi:phosphate-selective porin OprO/OprP
MKARPNSFHFSETVRRLPSRLPLTMKSIHQSKLGLTLLATLVAANFSAPQLRADDSGQIDQLEHQIQALQARLDALAQKQADEKAEDDKTAAAVQAEPNVSFNDGGLVVADPSGASAVHVGTLVQFDSREFFQDGGGVLNNGFFLRRARLILDGQLDKIYLFQFVPEFGNGSGGTANAVTILDANVTIAPTQALQFKAGKYKDPIGLEELQADQNTFFVERSLANDLDPNRDVGAEFLGNVNGGAVNYSLGLFNGTPDNLSSSGNSSYDNDKDVVGRLFLEPFVANRNSLLQGLGFGVAGDLGREKTHNAVTSGYKTDGQQTFFSYNSAVYVDGDVWRISPQAYYYHGSFGAIAESVESTINARPTAPTATVFPPKVTVENKASAITLSYVLTGEDSTYTGVTPIHPFSLSGGTWGALQVVARWEDLDIDHDAFVGKSPLASPITNADKATAVGAGFNWYLSKPVRISLDFFDTRFGLLDPTAATPQILLHNEKALTTRVQFSF